MNETDRGVGARRVVDAIALAAVVCALTSVAAAQPTADDFDKPIVLHAVDTAPAKLLIGPGFRVEDAVPTDGLTTRFTIRSDVGVFEAWGVESLALRVAEIPAIRLLDEACRSDAFARAAANTAARPLQPAGSGLEIFFAEAPGATRAAPAVEHEKELREVARRLGVDPYTANPLLAVRLDQLAWVAHASRVGVSALLPTATPASIAMPGTEVAHHWVYDTPRSELIAKNEQRLRGFGAADEQIRALQAAAGFTLSAQTALVEALGRLAEVQGRADVVALAAGAATPEQALYLLNAVSILADRNEQAPIDVLLARGTLVARQTSGQLVAPIPADYVSWNERLARFAAREDLVAPERGVWISGRSTARARERLEALGWAVHEGVKP